MPFLPKGRPGNFWNRLLAEPLVSAFPGVKSAKLEGFPFFPNRSVILSVGIRSAGEFDANTSEAEIRDLCLKDARSLLANSIAETECFLVTKKGTDAEVSKFDGNASLPSINFSELSQKVGTLRMGRTDDGGYLAIIGGVVNEEGVLESHGRWLPYPILVPMMVGTAMSLEKEYYSADASFELAGSHSKPYRAIFPQRNEFELFTGPLINWPGR